MSDMFGDIHNWLAAGLFMWRLDVREPSLGEYEPFPRGTTS
jgi:hypothetical protein